MKKFFALALLLLPLAGQAQPTTALPYQCAARESGKLYWGKSSAREDWARASALEACRKEARRPAKCVVSHCTDNSGSQPDPDPTPMPNPPEDGSCDNSVQCHGFEVCVNHRCMDKGSSDNRCFSGIDCGFPQQCRNGRCLDSSDDECSSSSNCSGFQMCVGRKCVDRGSSDNRCSGSFDCGFPANCVDGSCQ